MFLQCDTTTERGREDSYESFYGAIPKLSERVSYESKTFAQLITICKIILYTTMSKNNKKTGKGWINTKKWNTWVFIIVLVLYLGYFSVMCWLFPGNLEKRGQFGDMFGALGALFSGLAFAGLIITIMQQREDLKNHRDEINLQREDLEAQTEALRLQKEEIAQTNEELKSQRKEMEEQNMTIMLQRFENTFFNMLNL